MTLSTSQAIDSDYDIIDFLAIAQARNLSLLPITWQSAEDLTNGKGATSQLQEAILSSETSFAFKCVGEKYKKDVERGRLSKSKIFGALMNEICALNDLMVQKMLGVVNLEGLAWDISSDNDIWPVLVFEKSNHGDLEDYLTTHSSGINESANCRVADCHSIGITLSELHSVGESTEIF
jgi:hypothetical protein